MVPVRALGMGVLAGLLTLGCGGAGGGAGDRPHVLLIVIDTLRADRLGAYGYGRPTSPVIDGLAEEGVLFEDVTAQCSWTLPSMVSMFQGRYLPEFRDVYLDDAPTLAEVFRDAGYRTVGVVGNGLLSDRAGFDRGFDHYDARKRAKDGRPGSAARSGDDILATAREPVRLALAPEDGRAVPLFLYLHLMDPHDPYQAHEAYDDVLPRTPSASGHDLARQREAFGRAFPERASNGAVGRAWERMAGELARYDQEVRYTDEVVGRALAMLEEHGALEDTVIAIVSDHGEGLYDHLSAPGTAGKEPGPARYFQLQHGKQIYGELTSTPMILAGAGVPAGVRVSAAVENVDLLPTLVELAGLEPVPGQHGRSLVAAMHGAELEARPVFSAVLRESSVRDAEGRWKLLVPAVEGDGREVRLYDLRSDRGERTNLAAEHPAVVEELMELLRDWQTGHAHESTLGRPKDPQTVDDMRELGYAGDDG